MSMNRIHVVGIDVSKADLVVAWSWDEHRAAVVTNDEAGCLRLVEQLRQDSPELVVLEATGGYERLVMQTLLEAAIPVARVNPRRVRDFARSQNRLAKTDSIDARVIAQFGQQAEVRALSLDAGGRQAQLQELVRHRHDLVQDKVRWQNRLDTALGSWIRETITAQMQHAIEQIAAVEAAIDDLIDAWPEEASRAALIQSMPGIGIQNARVLVADLPELGTLNRKQIAALVGVAPFNRDSGRYRGKRAVWGGRSLVRTTLYMALTAIKRHNPVLSAWHASLIARGKPRNVANVALIRRAITILNAMLRDGRAWQSPLAESV